MGNKVIKELNTILKGEQMAVNAYGRFIQDAEDENIKNEFAAIQQDHKRHARQLAERIRVLGGEPEFDTGFAGFMASVKMRVEDLGKNEIVDILKRAYDGEDKGIAMVEEIKKDDLDTESADMVNDILSQDHDHLKKMAHMIADFEYKH